MTVPRTDLALEAADDLAARAKKFSLPEGIQRLESLQEGYPVTDIRVTGDGARTLGKPAGRYITVDLTPCFQRQQAFFHRAVWCIAYQLRALLPHVGRRSQVLVVGLGNRAMTPDAIGPIAVENLLVTRHMVRALPRQFQGFTPVSALCTGVLARTGLETLELIQGAAAHIRPAAVIAIDALAARSRQRLCATVQLSDTGLIPGSGVGNHRRAVDRAALGVPVIAVGVPTVIDGATLCADLLEEAPTAAGPLRPRRRSVRDAPGHRPAGDGAGPHSGLRHHPGPSTGPDAGGCHRSAGITLANASLPRYNSSRKKGREDPLMEFNPQLQLVGLLEWMHTQMEACHGRTAVIGISGGKDSSTVAALAAAAYGRDHMYGVLMPNGVQPDIDYSQALVEHLQIPHCTINIHDAVQGVLTEMERAGLTPSRQTVVNLPSRIRMSTLYAVAQSLDAGVVINTSNLSEDWVGYCTIYGDSAGAFSPLGMYTTEEVIALGRQLGLPEKFLIKPPSDGLTGLTDEDNLGFTYHAVNEYVRRGTVDPAIKEQIDNRHRVSRFKFQTIPVYHSGLPMALEEETDYYK